MRRALLLLPLCAPVLGDPPSPRALQVSQAFYRAVFLVADGKADEDLAKASAFARAEMHPAVIARIPALLPSVRDLKPDEVRGLLESRQGQRHQASYGGLTCLFVDARSWVKAGKSGKAAWVQAPLTGAQRESIWKTAGRGARREALIALYASSFGKETRAFSSTCRGCDGRPRSPDLKLGQVITPKGSAPATAHRDSTCRSCRGVGVVVSMMYR